MTRGSGGFAPPPSENLTNTALVGCLAIHGRSVPYCIVHNPSYVLYMSVFRMLAVLKALLLRGILIVCDWF